MSAASAATLAAEALAALGDDFSVTLDTSGSAQIRWGIDIAGEVNGRLK